MQYDEAKRYFARSLAIYQRTPCAACAAAATIRYVAAIDERLGDNPAALAGFRQNYEGRASVRAMTISARFQPRAWFAPELTLVGQSQAALAMVEPALPKWRRVVGVNSVHLRQVS